MHAYYCLYRPPQYGAVPAGYDPDKSTFHLPRIKESVQIGDGSIQEIHHFGELQYPARLPFSEIYRYELRIADPTECALYTIWINQKDDTEIMIEDYASQGLDWVNEYLDGGSFDSMLLPMKVLLLAFPDKTPQELASWAKTLIG